MPRTEPGIFCMPLSYGPSLKSRTKKNPIVYTLSLHSMKEKSEVCSRGRQLAKITHLPAAIPLLDPTQQQHPDTHKESQHLCLWYFPYGLIFYFLHLLLTYFAGTQGALTVYKTPQ
ncbi:UNVERIFIED_CONTAM: hypothetical protein K2H54_010028 [Gekko kuhli]